MARKKTWQVKMDAVNAEFEAMALSLIKEAREGNQAAEVTAHKVADYLTRKLANTSFHDLCSDWDRFQYRPTLRDDTGNGSVALAHLYNYFQAKRLGAKAPRAYPER